jgi:two-component system, OmpR family, sensor kinase
VSLQVRVPLVAMAILATTLAVTAFLAYEFLLITRTDDLESILRREIQHFERSLPHFVAGVAEEDRPNISSSSAVRLAVQRYLERDPAGGAFFSLARFDGFVLISPQGPTAMERLADQEALPMPRSSEIETFETTEGDLLSLATDFPVGDGEAVFQVLAPLRPVQVQSIRSLGWLGLAALAGLALGATVLAIILRRSLRPLRDLASTARVADLDDLSQRVPESGGKDEVALLSREINGMLERLERAARDQREFMAAVSHELRTPVTIARGHIEVLESLGAADQEDRERMVTLVREELVRIQRLVEDLMALARSQAKDFVIHYEVRLPAFFQDLRLRLAGLSLNDVRLDQVPDVVIWADGERLAQAMLNLIINAEIHTPAGTPVLAGAHAHDGDVALFVRDKGPGFDPRLREAIPRQVLDHRSGRRSGGLGLAVVAAIVDAHGGKVDVDTGASGTTVTLRIPLRAR